MVPLSRIGSALTPPTLAAGLAAASGLLACVLSWPLLSMLDRVATDHLALRQESAAADRMRVVETGPLDAPGWSMLLQRIAAGEPRAIVVAVPLPLPPAVGGRAGLARALAADLRAWGAALETQAGRDVDEALRSRWHALGLAERAERLAALPPAASAGPAFDLATELAPVLRDRRLILAQPPGVLPAWAWAVDTATADADGVLRRELRPEPDAGTLSLATLAAAALNADPDMPAAEAVQALLAATPGDRDGHWRPRGLAPRRGQGPAIPTIDAASLLAAIPDPDLARTWRDRLVIVDAAARPAPYRLPGLGTLGQGQALAQRVAALADGALLRRPVAGAVLCLVAVVLAAGVAGVLMRRGRPMLAGVVVVATAGGLILVSLLVLKTAGIWLAPLPAATWLLGAGAAVPVLARLGLSMAADAGRPVRLGRYRVESELGRGAMGVVYLGFDPRIGRRVALKTLDLSPRMGENQRAAVKRRFFSEAAAAGRLSHPGIVQIYDADEHRGTAFIAMELIEGHDLSRHTHRHALLPVPEVLGHLAEAAEALHYAHRQGVIHRDVKPANLIRVRASGRVKLTDFGLAGAAEESAAGAATTLGSPAYMSPEQLAGKALDGRSDLYSLGATGYQLLTGQLPLRGDSLDQLMQRIVGQTPVPPSQVRRDLPPPLDAVIGRLLQKQPAQRYPDAGAVAADLRRLAAATNPA